MFIERLQGQGTLEDEPLAPGAAPTWHRMTPRLVTLPVDATRLRVAFDTRLEGKITSRLYLRQVISQLRLPELSSASTVKLVLDPGGKNQIEQTRQPFLLCHGAEHVLQIKSAAGDAWSGQPVSLIWMDDNQHPPSAFGMSARPPLNQNAGDQDDRYQPLDEGDGAQWQLQAGATAAQAGEIGLGLGSYWQAPRFELKAQLGDFRHDLGGIEWDGVVPVVEYGNSTQMSVILHNVFVPDRPAVGRPVKWLLNDTLFATQPTDAKGLSSIEYLPKPGDEGVDNNAVFKAVYEDELKQVSEQVQKLPVFAVSPWGAELEVLVEGKPVADFEKIALLLTRQTEVNLTLKPKKADSFFVGKPILLRWPNGKPERGITFTPTAAQTMTPEGISWTLKGGTDSGTFVLETATDDLSAPFSLKGAQLSAELGDEVELSLDADAVGSTALLRRGTAYTLRLQIKPGSPLPALGRTGRLSFTEGTLKPGHVPAQPDYEAKREVPAAGLSWTLTAGQNSGDFALAVHVEGFAKPLSFDNAMVLSSQLSDEAQLQIDGAAVPAIALFQRGAPRTLSLVPRAGSPLGRLQPEAWLVFEAGSLVEAKVPSTPAYFTKRNLGAAGLSWSLKGQQVSGDFALTVEVEGFEQPLSVSKAVLLSADLSDEAELKLQGAAVPNPAIFRRGQPTMLTLQPKAGSPLGGLGLSVYLEFVGRSLGAPDMSATPYYGVGRALGTSGLQWALEGGEASGDFGIRVVVAGRVFSTTLEIDQALLLSTRLEDEVEVSVNGKPVSAVVFMPWDDGMGSAPTLFVSAKPQSPLHVLSPPCRLTFQAGTLEAKNLQASPAFGATQPLANGQKLWTLSGGNQVSGGFGMQLHVEGFEEPLSMPRCVLHSNHFHDEFYVTAPESEFDSRRDTVLALTATVSHPGFYVHRRFDWGWGMDRLVTLNFVPGTVTESSFVIEPAPGEQVALVFDRLLWQTRHVSKKGECALNFSCDVMLYAHTVKCRISGI
ncbi:hypothetical protein ACK2SD_14460 [Pseudomonas sp. SC11]|uniref:hypothetical protein n=1 Tax=Pseudomonas sp. SC11 TaxID=326927 RepID=UPI00399BC8CB